MVTVLVDVLAKKAQGLLAEGGGLIPSRYSKTLLKETTHCGTYFNGASLSILRQYV